MSKITTLFLDVGGVLLTNGWDRHSREEAARVFDLNYEEMNERHHLTYDVYEEGNLTLEDYLNRTVFYKERPFTYQQFLEFMYEQSKPLPYMIEYLTDLKKEHNLKIAVVSNEGRDLTLYRVNKFNLPSFVDFFIFSSFVHIRKPDPKIWQLALDVAMVPKEEVLYIDDREMLTEVAKETGINVLHHKGFEETKAALDAMGLSLTMPVR